MRDKHSFCGRKSLCPTCGPHGPARLAAGAVAKRAARTVPAPTDYGTARCRAARRVRALGATQGGKIFGSEGGCGEPLRGTRAARAAGALCLKRNPTNLLQTAPGCATLCGVEMPPCSKCGSPVQTYRDKAHKFPSSYCKPCNNKEMRLRRQFRRRGYERLWVQKDRSTNERRYATRPCPDECEVCGAPGQKGDRRPLDFDHCHESGNFRGWLCHNCNMVIGYAKDAPGLLRQLARYLEDFELKN
jgi:Recombination endonuclease VII